MSDKRFENRIPHFSKENTLVCNTVNETISGHLWNGHWSRMCVVLTQRECVNVRHLAIDRPSPKFLSFLQKHYKLKATVPQVNNFVIFDGFFNDRPGQFYFVLFGQIIHVCVMQFMFGMPLRWSLAAKY